MMRTASNALALTLLITLCSLVGCQVSSAQSFNWLNDSGGTFTLSSNWSSLPTFLSGADETLNFNALDNDGVPGYQVNGATGFSRLVNFNNTYGSPLIDLQTGSTFVFNSAGGMTPQLNQNGFGIASIGAFRMDNSLTIGGTGSGNLTMSAITNNTASGNTLTINQLGGGFSHTGAVMVFGGAGNWSNATTANTVINGGNVAIGNSTALGGNASNRITFNGGSFRFNGSGLTLANNWTLNSSLNLSNSNSAVTSATISGVMSGVGGLNIQNIATFTLNLTNANTFTGDVIFNPIGSSAGGITLSGASGSISNSANVTIFSQSSLTLNNSTAPSSSRLSNNVNLTLNRANLVHEGNSSVATTTQIGTLNTLGTAWLVVNPGNGSLTGAGSTVSIGSWNRQSKSTGFFLAGNMGATPGANTGTVVIANDPGGAIGGILPYAYAHTSINTLVRYDVATSRLVGLNHGTDYHGGLPASQVMELYRNTNKSANYRATVTQAGLGNSTVNALVLDSNGTTAGFVGTSVSGPGTLNVTSGAILSTIFNGSAAPTPIASTIGSAQLNFGANTGYVHTSYNLNITSSIAGSGGLVKSGFGNLTLTGNNSFTGDVFLNSGVLSITEDVNLGDASNVINMNGGLLGTLAFNPSTLFSHGSQTTLNSARSIVIGATGGRFSVDNVNNTMTLSGPISGDGYLFKGGAGTLNLTGNNSYTGDTTIFSGVLKVANDAAMGNTSGRIVFSAGGPGILEAGSSFSTNRNVLLQSSAIVFTNGNNLTLNGVVGTQNNANPVAFTKLGLGDLTLTNTNTYNGTTTVGGEGLIVQSAPDAAQQGGRLVLSGAAGSIAMSSGIIVNSGATLRLDNSQAINDFRVGRVGVTMRGGGLEIIGNSASNSSTVIGALTSSGFANTITLDQSTGTGSTLNKLAIASYTNPTDSSITFIRGSNLGAANGDRTAVVINSPVPTHALLILPSLVGSNSATGLPTEFLKRGPMVNNQQALEVFSAYSVNAPAAGLSAVADINSSVGLTANSVIGAVRLSSGGNVDIAGSHWTIHSGSMISNGANNAISNSSATSRSLVFGGTVSQTGGTVSGFGRITNNGNLTIGPNVLIAATNINKFGAGDLILNSGSTASIWNISQGTVRFGVSNAISGATVNINSNATLDLNNNSGVSLGTITGFGNVNVGSGGLTLSAQGGSFFAGKLSGTGAMTLTSQGTFTVAGDNNQFSGQWNVRAGNLQAQSSKALGTGLIRLGSTSSALDATLSLGSLAPTVIANEIEVLNNPFAARYTILHAPGTSGIFTGDIQQNSFAGLRFNGAVSSTTLISGAWTIAGRVSGTQGIQWLGGNWNFWGDNSDWSGSMSIASSAANQFGVGSDTAFGTGTLQWSNIIVNGAQTGGMIRADNGARVLNNNVSVFASSNLFSVTGVNDLTFTGLLSLATAGGNHNINVVSTGTTSFKGTIVGASTTSSMSQTGFGKLVLSGNNTFAGGYTLNSGVLGLGNNMALGTGGLTINEGGIIQAENSARVIANNVTIGGHFGIAGSNALTLDGNMNLGASHRTVIVSNTADTTFSGIISGAIGTQLTKEGAGKLIVTNSNTYSGITTIAGGALLVNNVSGSGTGTGIVKVNPGATLGGTGSVSGQVIVDGILSPGASLESLSSGALILNASSTYLWEASDDSATGADLMQVNGTLTLNNATLDLSLANLAASSWSLGAKLTLFSYSGTALTGGFDGYADDVTYSFGSNKWTLNYNDTMAGANFISEAVGPNYVTFSLTAVPEPTALLLVLMPALVISLSRSRKRCLMVVRSGRSNVLTNRSGCKSKSGRRSTPEGPIKRRHQLKFQLNQDPLTFSQ